MITTTAMAANGAVLASAWVGDTPSQMFFQVTLSEAQARLFAKRLLEAADECPREATAADLGITRSWHAT